MDKAALYKAINDAQFSVEEFEAPPRVFGSWHVVFNRGNQKFRIVYDGRDSFLSLERNRTLNDWEDITYVVSTTMSSEQKIMQINSWLLNIAKKFD